jgi:membrane-associated phospholipid phosphatase
VRLRPVDRVLLGYVGVTSVVAAARLHSTPPAGWVLVANALVILLIALANRAGEASWLTDLYPICILLGLYGALDLLAGHGGITTHDETVQRWEAAVFGGQVSREWWQRAPSRFWSTLLHGAYFSYYLVIPAGPLWFLWKGNRRNLRRVVLAEVTAFVLCYLIFIFFPVAGPYYEFPRPSPEFLDNGAARLVYGTLAKGSSYGAAFPSSHVAGVIAAIIACTMGSRALGAVLAVPGLLLTVGVVYCQMHYGVDALAGIVLGVVGALTASTVNGQRYLTQAAHGRRWLTADS